MKSSGREAFPFLDDLASKHAEPILFFLPLLGGIGFPFLPPPLPRPLRRRSGPQSLRTLCPKYPCDEGRPWSLWPPSRPSSSAPCKAPGQASSSEVGRLVLLAAGPDSRSAPPSSSSPRRIIGKYIRNFPQSTQIKRTSCQYMKTHRTCGTGQFVPAILDGVWPRLAGFE